ncbi:MAG TPA: hypothetical protein VGM86_03310 [Thermoanaerobaculia bacterium]|jgi:hypothetical protein
MTPHRPSRREGDPSPPDAVYKLHAVVFRHGEWLIAQCLEHDITVQARSNAELYYEVKRILVAHLIRADDTGAEPFAHIPKAPKRFWLMYKEAQMELSPLKDLDFPAATVRPVDVELRAA